MQTGLSLPPGEDMDAKMLKVARGIAQDIYPVADIIKAASITGDQFEAMKKHPRFQGYVISEREAWLSAGNIEERTKLKAGIVLETWMDSAYTEMTNKANALNQRVELGKMLAKIAGFGEPRNFMTAGGASGPGFMLQINIGPGVEGGTRHETITIQPEVANLPDKEWEGKEWDGVLSDDLDANEVAIIKKMMAPPDEDEYDPFTSPVTIEDDE